MTLNLTTAKSIVKGNEVITLTLTYPPDLAGKEAVLQERGVLGGSTVISKAIANSSGQTTFAIKAATQGEHTYWCTVSPCYIFLNCDYSNDVKVSVTDAPCDTWDIGCRISPQLDTKLIAAAVIIIVILLILVYFTKKR